MGRVDRASLLIHADPTRVWDALTRRDALEEWLPPTGMSGRFEHFDLREGGSYRLVLTYDDPSGSAGKTTADADVVTARIARLVTGGRVVQLADFASDDPAFAGTMAMDWAIRAADGGTEVTFEARDVPEGIGALDHAVGLTSSLVNLAAFLAR